MHRGESLSLIVTSADTIKAYISINDVKPSGK